MIDITNIINLPTKVGETLTLKPADCTNKFYHSLNNWIGSSTWKDWAAKTAKEAKFGKRNLSNNIEIQIGSAFHLLLEDEEQFNNEWKKYEIALTHFKPQFLYFVDSSSNIYVSSIKFAPFSKNNISPLPSNCSAPISFKIVLLSNLLATL